VTRGITREDIVAEVENENAEGSLAFADHRRRTGARATSLRPDSDEVSCLHENLWRSASLLSAECRLTFATASGLLASHSPRSISFRATKSVSLEPSSSRDR